MKKTKTNHNWVWYSDLYVGKKAESEKKKIRRNFEEGKGYHPDRDVRIENFIQEVYRYAKQEEVPDWANDNEEAYLICLGEPDSGNLLDLYPEHSVLQEYYDRKKLHVMGIAKGHADAVAVAAMIVSDYMSRGESEQKKSMEEYFFE